MKKKNPIVLDPENIKREKMWKEFLERWEDALLGHELEIMVIQYATDGSEKNYNPKNYRVATIVGPIESIRIYDGRVYFKMEWAARFDMGNSNWVKHDQCEYNMEVDYLPTRQGCGVVLIPILAWGHFRLSTDFCRVKRWEINAPEQTEEDGE